MGTGNVTAIDQEVLSILAQGQATTGPLMLGPAVFENRREFEALTKSFKAEQSQDRDLVQLKFAALYASRVIDVRDEAATKTTLRTHTYIINTFVQWENQNTYTEARQQVEWFMDQLHNNYRPYNTTAFHMIGATQAAELILDQLQDEFLVYRGEIAFEVEERVAHD